jgi:peptidoglycan/LPS O-acetylase OafA/YrhL
LSGFLVTGSLQRSSLTVFVANRFLRIVPALSVEVLISALLLGPLLTTLPWTDYFGDAKLTAYFANIVGIIHYKLPGVFLSNPYPETINLSLWTVPYELECYLALIAAGFLGMVRHRRLMLWLTVSLHILLFIHDFTVGDILSSSEALPPRVLVLCFLCGSVIWLYQDRIEVSPGRALLAAATMLALFSAPLTSYLATFPAAYAVVAVGLQNPPRTHLVTSGDYSYGMYLYAFPIQQSLITVLPGLRGFQLFIVASVLAFLAAMLSWHFVEKHALSLRRYFSAMTAPAPTQDHQRTNSARTG